MLRRDLTELHARAGKGLRLEGLDGACGDAFMNFMVTLFGKYRDFVHEESEAPSAQLVFDVQAFSESKTRSKPTRKVRPALLRSRHLWIMGSFSSSLPNSKQTFCMLNRHRELTLLRPPTATPAATSSA